MAPNDAPDDTSNDDRPDPDESEPGTGQGHRYGGCTDALTELYTYLDGELTEEKRTLIRTHLDDCNPCFEAFDFEAELRIVISHRCRDTVPESLRRRIADQLTAAEPPE